MGSARRSRTRGQSLVEFALVIPVFFLLLAGVLDFGFMLYSRMTIINAAREGARVAAQTADRTTIPAIVPAKVTSVSTGLVTSSPDMQVTVSCVAIATPGSCSFSTTTSSTAGDAIRVSVSYRYHTFFPLLFGAVIDLGSSVQMVLE
jgi:Flp pilus assembly protein TadG